MSYFTYLWKNETWKKKASQSRNGYTELDYAASDQFSARGVKSGSTLFIVTVKGGGLFLGGYIKIASITDFVIASKMLGRNESEIWEAGEYALAEEDEMTSFREDLRVDDAIVRALELSSGEGGFVNLKIDANGKIDRQTLRGVRQLYRGEEKKLFKLLQP